MVGALAINQKLEADSANAFGGAGLIGNGSSTSEASAAPVDVKKSATGDPVDYLYGTIQVSITQLNGKLTAIELLQQQATAGREQAFPYLVKYAIAANGSNFGNLSNATYTTDAFKQALDSAISKL